MPLIVMNPKLCSILVALLLIFTSLGHCWDSYNPTPAAFADQPGGMFPLKPGDFAQGTYNILVGPAGTNGLTLPPPIWSTFGPYNFRGGHKYSVEIVCGYDPNPNIVFREDPAWLLNYAIPPAGMFRVYVRNKCNIGDTWYAVELQGTGGAGGLSGSTSDQEFKWAGMGADKIGAWDNGNPNGVPDGHFVLNLDLPSSTEIKSILVYSSDADGNPVNGQFWDTAESDYYMIGVFDRGTQLNMHHVPTLGTFSGPVQLDLYCEDSGWFKSGSWFGLKVTFGDGTKLERLIPI